MTKQSSTPIPINKKGRISWTPPNFMPIRKANPVDAPYAKPTQRSEIPAAADLKCNGLHEPMKTIQ